VAILDEHLHWRCSRKYPPNMTVGSRIQEIIEKIPIGLIPFLLVYHRAKQEADAERKAVVTPDHGF
jgi:hypothetical protein